MRGDSDIALAALESSRQTAVLAGGLGRAVVGGRPLSVPCGENLHVRVKDR